MTDKKKLTPEEWAHFIDKMLPIMNLSDTPAHRQHVRRAAIEAGISNSAVRNI